APPTLVPTAKVIALGMAPGAVEEAQGRPFVGPSGEMLRQALRQAGLDPTREVSYLNLARCRPEGDNFESKESAQAERRCAQYLAQDLAQHPPDTPLLLLGTRPLRRMLGDRTVRLGAYRGLWIGCPDGRPAFVERHPAQILRTEPPAERQRL